MRLALVAVFVLMVGSGRWLPAAAPPAQISPRLIEQLSDADPARRRAAMKQLEQLDEIAVPLLRAAARQQRDIDSALRLHVVARAILDRNAPVLVKAFGAGAPIRVRPFGDGYWLNRVQFSRDGKYAVVGGGGLILFDLSTGKEVARALEFGGARPALAVARDGKHVLTGHASHSAVHLCALPGLRIVTTFTGHTGGIFAVALSPNSLLAASASSDRTVRLWDVRTGKARLQMKDLGGIVRCLTFSPDGKYLLTGQDGPGKGARVRLFDLDRGKERLSLDGHTGSVVGLAIRPDGKIAITAGGDGSLCVWDLETAKQVRRMHHGGAVNDLALSPDGRRVLSAGFRDRLVKLWDIETGRLLDSLSGHVGGVLGVAFAPDGRMALSSDSICCVRLWKVGR